MKFRYNIVYLKIKGLNMRNQKAKQFTVVTDYGMGQEANTYLFTVTTSNEEIENGIIPTLVNHYENATLSVSYDGEVELTGNYVEIQPCVLVTEEEMSAIMSDYYEDVCPGGQGYDR